MARLFTFLLLFSGTPSVDQADVSFLATGPMGMKIEGKTSELALAEDDKSVTVTVGLTKLDTGMGMRDRHMRDKYLQVQTYPTATLRLHRDRLHYPAAGAEASGDTQGDLTLHGKTKVVTIHYTAKNDGGGFAVTASMHLNMNDFGIEKPTYMGATVKPDVDVNVRFHFKDP